MVLPTVTLGEVWSRHHDPLDQFLYLQLTVESAFG